MVRTEVWLILQPIRRGYDGQVTGIEVDRILKTKPGRLGVRDIAVKVNVEVDERMFVTPAPEVTLRLDDERSLIIPKLAVDVPVTNGPEEAGEETEEDPSERTDDTGTGS